MKYPAFLAMTAAVSTVGLTAVPASAQDAAGDRVNQLIVYGDDECPQSKSDEIVVCARKAEEERYRIPKDLRANPNDPKNEAWSRRVQAYEVVGRFGTDSCTPTGIGGTLGCTQALIDRAYAEKASAPEENFGRLIEKARQERLAKIDAEAEAVELRVLEIEKARAEREARNASATAELESDVDATGATLNPLAVPPSASDTPGASDTP